MPEAVSNNAVASATQNGETYVYSFSGIDTTKDWFGIHLKSFRYNVQANLWDSLPPLPDPNGGKIAAAASTVKNKIYIIGGYHVASNYTEVSSNKVHIFDPESNSFLNDGTPIPKAIDDQVQAVWRDSLIYVVSGWSNTGNVTNVQIYNPSTDTWTAGTPIPNSSNYKVFGGSGTIIGDTIYYAGGAKSVGNFPATTYFRKGYINPNNPTEITWEGYTELAAMGYRMAASSLDEKALWFGGSDITYNFNGIAYNSSGGVPALGRITIYDPNTGQLEQIHDFIPPTMDLRSIAKISENQYIIAGGMQENQSVTNRTLLITIDNINAIKNTSLPEIKITPNPASDWISFDKKGSFDVQITNLQGKIVFDKKGVSGQINISALSQGKYILSIIEDGKITALTKFVLVR